MKLFIKKTNPNALLPKRCSDQAAGYDLATCLEQPLTLKVGETGKIPTGISVQPEESDVALLLYPRSSLATKYGITFPNSVGVIDSDYRGEIFVAMTNSGSSDYTFTHNERIAQLIVTPIIVPEIVETEVLTDTARGTGGFGSTGKI